MATIFTSPFFVSYLLPFILVFTVVFAILQKSGILGKDKKQIDAIVGFVIGLIVISFANAVGIINSLLPFLAVAVVVILVFLILLAMVYVGADGKFEIPKIYKVSIGALAAITVLIAVLIVTGAWDYLVNTWFGGASGEGGITNFIFIILVLVVIGFIVWPKDKKDKP
ncbi:MAG: hypothetical protein U1E54_05170 [Candidatus Levybacteria bacterium]|nr:hypothetical protein [Candidatus Levybacteria bacterium]